MHKGEFLYDDDDDDVGDDNDNHNVVKNHNKDNHRNTIYNLFVFVLLSSQFERLIGLTFWECHLIKSLSKKHC